jgi:hypothetical protein
VAPYWLHFLCLHCNNPNRILKQNNKIKQKIKLLINKLKLSNYKIFPVDKSYANDKMYTNENLVKYLKKINK